jgi:hypothetical protein
MAKKHTLPVALRLCTVLLASTLSPQPLLMEERTVEVEEAAAESIIVPRWTQERRMGGPGWTVPGLDGLVAGIQSN